MDESRYEAPVALLIAYGLPRGMAFSAVLVGIFSNLGSVAACTLAVT
jgi:hypothetical protein